MTKHEQRRMDEVRRSGAPGVVREGAPATERQMAYIEALARRAGYRSSAEAVKACLGKNPIGGLSRGRASMVIEFLQATA
ncbi:MAG TPA: hypothetical protein PLQ97_15045 [Myxococcota bacterium]|nr:hypothetical protein [Myxococcota bacterium]